MTIFVILNIVFCTWVIFLGGAARLENTLAGYFEFGIYADKEVYIKIVAWVSLAGSAYYLLS